MTLLEYIENTINSNTYGIVFKGFSTWADWQPLKSSRTVVPFIIQNTAFQTVSGNPYKIETTTYQLEFDGFFADKAKYEAIFDGLIDIFNTGDFVVIDGANSYFEGGKVQLSGRLQAEDGTQDYRVTGSLIFSVAQTVGVLTAKNLELGIKEVSESTFATLVCATFTYAQQKDTAPSENGNQVKVIDMSFALNAETAPLFNLASKGGNDKGFINLKINNTVLGEILESDIYKITNCSLSYGTPTPSASFGVRLQRLNKYPLEPLYINGLRADYNSVSIVRSRELDGVHFKGETYADNQVASESITLTLEVNALARTGLDIKQTDAETNGVAPKGQAVSGFYYPDESEVFCFAKNANRAEYILDMMPLDFVPTSTTYIYTASDPTKTKKDARKAETLDNAFFALDTLDIRYKGIDMSMKIATVSQVAKIGDIPYLQMQLTTGSPENA